MIKNKDPMKDRTDLCEYAPVFYLLRIRELGADGLPERQQVKKVMKID